MVIAFSNGIRAYDSNLAALSGGQNLDIEIPKIGTGQIKFAQDRKQYAISNKTYVEH